MRDSIALRVTLAVFGTLALSQLVGFLLFTGERLDLLPWSNTARIEAMANSAVDKMLAVPAGQRGSAAAFDIGDAHAAWNASFTPRGEIIDPPPLFGLRRKMLEKAAGRFDMMLIEGGRPPGDTPPSFTVGPPGPPSIKIWLRLPDRSWLALDVPDRLLRQPDLVRMALWWTFSLLGAIPLSLFVARRLTAPIRRFSEAAERLGVDIAAEPLRETGPSELRTAAAAINGMQRRIKSFVDDRTEMLAAISHDLRTPISRLRLRAEGLAACDERSRIIADLTLMDQMIAATVDFARDANSGESRCRIDLASLVETECETLADLGKDIAYRGPAYVEFTCRPQAIGRAVRNILENAVEYGGRTEATILEPPDRVEIHVRDDGPGIPPEEQQRVFEPFYRLDRARSTEHQGSGLGLSIARNILRAHGGDVTLGNRAEGGLLVILSLPRAESTAR